MKELDDTRVRTAVRKHYANVAATGDSCCAGSCCGDDGASRKYGYSAEELSAVPEGADLGLGCGNPHAIASLSEG